MYKEEYTSRLSHLRNLLDARFLSLREYATLLSKIQEEFYSEQVLKNSNPCYEIDMSPEHMDDIWSCAINNRNPYYDTKSDSYKLLLKPLN